MMSKNDPFAGLRQPRLLVARLVDGVLFALQATVAAISLLQVSSCDNPSICMALGSLVGITLLRWLVMRGTAVAGYRGAYDGGLYLRAGILKDAPIVLLDEATSALDPENEHLIQLGVNALVREKTVIVVAHRLSTIVDADHIVVLDQSRVATSGWHEELLRSSQQYRNFRQHFA